MLSRMTNTTFYSLGCVPFNGQKISTLKNIERDSGILLPEEKSRKNQRKVFIGKDHKNKLNYTGLYLTNDSNLTCVVTFVKTKLQIYLQVYFIYENLDAQHLFISIMRLNKVVFMQMQTHLQQIYMHATNFMITIKKCFYLHTCHDVMSKGFSDLYNFYTCCALNKENESLDYTHEHNQ